MGDRLKDAIMLRSRATALAKLLYLGELPGGYPVYLTDFSSSRQTAGHAFFKVSVLFRRASAGRVK